MAMLAQEEAAFKEETNKAQALLINLDVSYRRLFAQRQSRERDVPNPRDALRLRDLVFMVEVSNVWEIIATDTFELKEWPDEGVISVEDVVMNVGSQLYSVGDLKDLGAQQLPCYDYKWSVLRKSDMMAFEDEAALEEDDFYTLEHISIGFALREGNLATQPWEEWPSAPFSEAAFLSWLMNEKANAWV
ncbi:hypothetical protein JL720_7062 [Aureococcus anophagefferens]|nr:hypothetical protein JL720_7062 [Aureococcus anophagefferens]